MEPCKHDITVALLDKRVTSLENKVVRSETIPELLNEIKITIVELKGDISEVKSEMKSDIRAVTSKIIDHDTDLKNIKTDLQTIKEKPGAEAGQIKLAITIAILVSISGVILKIIGLG